MDKARKAAVAAVVRVHRGGWANLALDAALPASLAPRDRAFASALFYATAEHLLTLDAVLAPFLKRSLDKLDVEVRAILETGLCQMRYMRVPPRAAVHEAVELAGAFGKSSARGFVNAVLRRASTAEVPAGAVASEEERISVEYSVGLPVVRAVAASLGEEAEAFFAASYGKPELALRANTLRTTLGELQSALEQAGANARPGPLAASLWARLPGGVAQEPLFESGLYHVLGMASQYAAACVGAVPGMRVLDLCAAPGGKSAALAQDMGGGAGLTVCDVHSGRLALAQKLLTRLGVQGVHFLENDASVYKEALAGQDAVLCDVPCSGLGVLAQKPDLRYTDGMRFAALPELQLKILHTASRYVKRGGRLVYATCTVRREENQGVVEAFLAANPGFRAAPPACAPEGAKIERNMMTILPQDTGLDGFFVASLESL